MSHTITLACIAGNAEKYIDRFLDSFQPFFDEVVIVRACGNQEPDRTLEIAEKRGCKVGVYENKIDWPHVDDFAAARNVAFDMAAGDWVMWADMDDTLIGGDRIKSDLEAMPDECVALGAPYDVPEDSCCIMRERIIRRGAARWVNPIHENLAFEPGVKHAETDRWKLLHKPLGERKPNDERNARILESIENPTGSQRFHLIQSLRAIGRIEDAVKQAITIIQEQPADLGTAELYETLFTLGQLTEDRDQRAQIWFRAIAVDPTRREAYGDLITCYLAAGEPEKALGLLRAMKAQPMPANPPWNIRRKFYGYREPLLEGMCYRACGHLEQGDTVETNHFLRNGAKISLLHATRGRPSQAVECRHKWLEAAANPDAIEHIFAIDLDDESAWGLTCHNHVWTNGRGGPVEGWNLAATKSKGQVLVQLSDDWNPPLHWDAMILDALGDLDAPKVLAVSDGHRKDDLLCMAILTRSRYRQQGYMFHPEFFSMYSDNWFARCAFKDGVIIDARDRITFEHMHPAFGKGENDATYARSNCDYNYITGKGIYRRLVEGEKTSADIHGWFDFRDVYDFIAKTLPEGGKVVEVGAWKGKSAIYLHDRLNDLDRPFSMDCVDTFKGDAETGQEDVYDEFLTNVGRRKIFAVQDDSAKAARLYDDASLDAVFIDAAHDYDSAKADIAAWRPKVKTGGFFGGHDIDAEGVQRALAELGIDFIQVGRCWIQQQEEDEKLKQRKKHQS